MPRGISRSVIGRLSTISSARGAGGSSAEHVGAQAVVLGVRRLAFLGPGARELGTALCLEPWTEVAAVAHLIEDGDRVVDPADREQGAAAGVLERRDIGTQRRRLVGERERGVGIALCECDARAVVEPHGTLLDIECRALDAGAQPARGLVIAPRDLAPDPRQPGRTLALRRPGDRCDRAIAAGRGAVLAGEEAAVAHARSIAAIRDTRSRA